ncbi:MAG TPA: NAD(P)/FAD-dependent oxidoreductase [Rhodanobacteraceae bacterium]
MRKFAVLGAGPMGLMATMELLKAGHEVDLYERDDRIGGMSASFDFDGLEIERYYHYLCKTDYAFFGLLEELGLSHTLKWVDTHMGYYYGGRLQDWGNPVALLKFRGLGLVDKFRYGLHALRAKSIKDWGPYDKMLGEAWVRRWVGPRAYDVLWKSLFDLKLYEYADKISAAWIGARIRRMGNSRRSLMHESLGYLEGGSATLLNAMDRFITSRGGRIHLKAGIQRIAIRDNRVTGVVVNGTETPCDALVWTAPIQFVPYVVPDLPPDFRARIDAIKNIPVACVILKLSHSISRNFWTNINDPEMAIPGVIEYSNLNPASGKTILYAPFYMPKTHPKWPRPDADFVDEVVGYLGKLNPSFRRDWVLASHLHRYDFAQTICPPGFYQRLPPMRTPVDGLYMADTSYYYPEDRSITESVNVARRLVSVALEAAK